MTPVLTMPTRSKPEPEADPVMSRREAEKYLGISKTQMCRLIAGELPGPRLQHARIGHLIKIKRSWLDTYLEASARLQERGR